MTLITNTLGARPYLASPPTKKPAAATTPADMIKPSDPKIVFVNPPQPVPKLPLPTVLIAGGKSRRVGLKPVIHYLTHGGNNSFGGVLATDAKKEFEDFYKTYGGNVFTVRFSTRLGSIPRDAEEIRQNLEQVRRVTGSEQINVVAECKGALSMRECIRVAGACGVRNLVLLVPPNHGMPVGGNMGWLASKLPFKRLWGVDMDADSRQAIASFRTDWKFGPLSGNPLIRALNTPENLDHESSSLHSITVIAGTGHTLLEHLTGVGVPIPILMGDDQVPEWSAFHPKANNFFYEGYLTRHPEVQRQAGVLAKIAESLTTDGAPARDQNYRERVPSGKRALAESALLVTAFAGRMHAVHSVASGALLGPAGVALGVVGAATSFLDGTRHLMSLPHQANGRDQARAVLGGLGRLAQGASVCAALSGHAGAAVALLGGGLVATFAAKSKLPPGTFLGYT